MHATVTYRDRNNSGPTQTAIVQVHQNSDGQFYAMGIWGCGKNSRTIKGAIRMLIQDMATILSIDDGTEPCPRCGGDFEFDEDGMPYTCFHCFDKGWVFKA